MDIPKDVTAAKTDFEPVEIDPIPRSTERITDEDVERAVEMICASERPYVFVGGGTVISDADRELTEFIDRVNAPVCDSLMGKGAFDGTRPEYTGMLGMHGTKTSNFGVSECDLLIAMGVRFSDRVVGSAKSFAKHAKILQFDVDPAEINKNIMTDASVIGDIKEILARLNPMIKQQDHKEWMNWIEQKKEEFPLVYPEPGLTGPFIMEEIDRRVSGDAIILAEVGQHQMWAAQYCHYRTPRSLLTSGGLGTMGFGLGAAIGAQVAHPEKKVINIAGDGCFRMNMIELMTAAREKLPIIEIVIDNRVLGMVHQWQELFYEGRYAATILEDDADFVKIAEGMGASGVRVSTQEKFAMAFEEALSAKGPVVIDCVIGSGDNVWPMVAPGAPINEAFDKDDLYNK